jgi:hypothetical protein
MTNTNMRKRFLLLLLLQQVLLPVLGLVAARASGIDGQKDARLDRAVAAVNRQIALNDYYLSINKPELTNYIVDMYEEVAKKGFISPAKKASLNETLRVQASAADATDAFNEKLRVQTLRANPEDLKKVKVYLLISYPDLPPLQEAKESNEDYKERIAAYRNSYTKAVAQRSNLSAANTRSALLNVDSYVEESKTVKGKLVMRVRTDIALGSYLTSTAVINALKLIKGIPLAGGNLKDGYYDAFVEDYVTKTLGVFNSDGTIAGEWKQNEAEGVLEATMVSYRDPTGSIKTALTKKTPYQEAVHKKKFLSATVLDYAHITGSDPSFAGFLQADIGDKNGLTGLYDHLFEEVTDLRIFIITTSDANKAPGVSSNTADLYSAIQKAQTFALPEGKSIVIGMHFRTAEAGPLKVQIASRLSPQLATILQAKRAGQGAPYYEGGYGFYQNVHSKQIVFGKNLQPTYLKDNGLTAYSDKDWRRLGYYKAELLGAELYSDHSENIVLAWLFSESDNLNDYMLEHGQEVAHNILIGAATVITIEFGGGGGVALEGFLARFVATEALRETAKDAVKGAAMDFGMQVTMYMLFENLPAAEAVKKVKMDQVSYAALQSAADLKGKYDLLLTCASSVAVEANHAAKFTLQVGAEECLKSMLLQVAMGKAAKGVGSSLKTLKTIARSSPDAVLFNLKHKLALRDEQVHAIFDAIGLPRLNLDIPALWAVSAAQQLGSAVIKLEAAGNNVQLIAQKGSRQVLATVEKGKLRIAKWATGSDFGVTVHGLENASVIPPGGSLPVRTDVAFAVHEKTGECGIVNGKAACFVAGTPVLTSGYSYKSIEQIRIGEKVLAKDVVTGEEAFKAVVEVEKHQSTRLIKLLAGSDTILVTPEHPFFVQGRWKPADSLEKGDRLIITTSHQYIAAVLPYLPRSSIEVDTIISIDTLATVYNLKIEEAGTYFVGKEGMMVRDACQILADIRSKFTSFDLYKQFVEDFRDNKTILDRFDRGDLSIDAWQALSDFKSLRKVVANLETVEEVSKRFIYNNKEGFDALAEVFKGHKSAQAFIANLSNAHSILKSVEGVSLSGIKSSSNVAVLSPNGENIATVCEGKVLPVKFLAEGSAVGDAGNGLELVINNNSLGFRNIDNISAHGTTFDLFNKSVNSGSGFPSQITAHKAYYLYREKKWGELEKLFVDEKLNWGWPPANGGFNIIGKIKLAKGMKFDRYQKKLIDKEINVLMPFKPTFTGEYTSPIYNNAPYSFNKRALDAPESTYALYYEIEILEDLSFNGELADIIPWFKMEGLGKQMKFEFPKEWGHNTWSTLLEGPNPKIRITIKSSPSGAYKVLPDGKIQKQ